MTRPVLLAHSRVFASTRPDAFEQVLRSDLRRVFDRGYGGIPRVVGVRAPGGQWGSPGQVRTIELSGGGSMREELRTVEPPTRFGYLLSGFTGPLRLLVTSIDGRVALRAVRVRTARHVVLDRAAARTVGCGHDARGRQDVAGLRPTRVRQPRGPAGRLRLTRSRTETTRSPRPGRGPPGAAYAGR